MTLLTFWDVLITALISLSALILIRNKLTYDIMMRHHSVISGINREIIMNWDHINGGSCPTLPYVPDISYDKMLWDLRKWSYEAFFPEGY